MPHEIAKEIIRKEKINENSPEEFHAAIFRLYNEYKNKEAEADSDYPTFYRYKKNELRDLFDYFAEKYGNSLGKIDEEILLRIKEKCEKEFNTTIYIKCSTDSYNRLGCCIQFAGGIQLSLYDARKLAEIITSCKTMKVEVIEECKRDDGSFYSLPTNFSPAAKKYTFTVSSFNLNKINKELDDVLPKKLNTEPVKSNFTNQPFENKVGTSKPSNFPSPNYTPTQFKSKSTMEEKLPENLKQATNIILSEFIKRKLNISNCGQITLTEFPFGMNGEIYLKISSFSDKEKNELISHFKQIGINASLKPNILREKDSDIIIPGNLKKLYTDLEASNKINLGYDNK